MKSCTVVACYFGERRNYPHNTEGAIKVNEFNINRLKNLDTGVKSDLILVNHLSGTKNPARKISKDFLLQYDGQKTKNGKIKILHRPYQNGIGLGFKSFDYAFKKLKNQYEYWFYLEDDFTISTEKYLSKCIKQLKALKKQNVCYSCCVGGYFGGCSEKGVKGKLITSEEERNCHKTYKVGVHCHGAMGCTHRDFLNAVIDKYGNLPHTSNTNYDESSGEVAFTNILVRMGYNLCISEDVIVGPIKKGDISI